MTRLLISDRARLIPESIVEWIAAAASSQTQSATAVTVSTAREWLMALPDDGSVEPPSGAIDRVLGHRELCEEAVVHLLGMDARRPATPRSGYRAVYLIGITGEWRSERAVPVLVDRLRTQRLFGTEETVLALIRIGPCSAPALWRLFSDPSARPIARANALRALCGLLQSAREAGVPSSFARLNDAWRRRLSSETLLLVSDPATAEDLRHEAILRLCDLRAVQSWPIIERAFRLQQVSARFGLSLATARDIMEGHVLLLDLPTWNTPMCVVEQNA